MREAEDIVGKTYGELTILQVFKTSGVKVKPKVLCKCSCGREVIRDKYGVTSGATLSCGHLRHSKNDLLGNTFGDITVIESVGRGRYKCKCICGAEKIVAGGDVRRGSGIKCTHFIDEERDELLGKKYGDLTVISRVGALYKCKCACGNTIDIHGSILKTGIRKSCGCLRDRNASKIVGMTFGYLKVIKYNNDGTSLCRCICGRERVYKNNNLYSGCTKSCGCMTSIEQSKAKDKMYNRVRTDEQLNAIQSRENIIEFINKTFIHRKPTIKELSSALGIGYAGSIYYINLFGIRDMIQSGDFVSQSELEIIDYIREMFPDLEIEQHNKKILHGGELDIYIPSKRIAIEYNGNYWHCELLKKDKHYHQKKTIECAKQGIRLIHIFEYEYLNNKEDVLSFIHSVLSNNKQVIQARKLKVLEIDKEEAKQFLDKNHLQHSTNCSIRIGLKLDTELVGVMTFGKPRFSNDYEYEVIRLAFKPGVVVTGGTEKMFSYFIREYNPQSILTYVDISKFTGNVYTRLGFKPVGKGITEPNYVWVLEGNNKVCTRYQTQKSKLVANNLGTESETEDEIMSRLCYIKIYDSGNLKLEWREG